MIFSQRHLILSLSTLFLTASAIAQVTISLPPGCKMKKITTTYALLTDIGAAKTEDDFHLREITSNVVNGRAQFNLCPEGAARYVINFTPDDDVSLYAQPGDKINVDIKSIKPFDYLCSGNELVRGLSEVEALQRPFAIEQEKIVTAGGPTSEAKLQDLYNRYIQAIDNYITENGKSEASLAALLNLSGQQFVDAYTDLNEVAERSLLAQAIGQKIAIEKREMERERKLQEFASGNVSAPLFILYDINDHKVNLYDYRGKWVILDFWGSWAPACADDFPSLKEAYEKYRPELEVLGIDCQDSDDAWKEAVKQYELPWVNLYSTKSYNLEQNYGVREFPTKMIVNPEGKIVDVTVGNDPDFYTRLAKFLDK